MMTIDYTPKTVLCIGAHMDDLDCHAGGLIAQWAAQGVKIYYLILTDGAMGSNDQHETPETIQRRRHKEQIAAARVLGVKWVHFAGFPDNSLSSPRFCAAVTREIVRHIRSLQPDTVLTLDPTPDYYLSHGIINHADHRAAGRAALDAANHLADNPRYLPTLTSWRGNQPLALHAVNHVLLATFSPSPSYFVDIAVILDLKIKAAHEHISQGAAGLERHVRNWAAITGAEAGLEFAEAYNGLIIRP